MSSPSLQDPSSEAARHGPASVLLAPASPSRLSRFWSTLREAIHGSQQNFTEGSLARAIFLLAVPMVLEMSMESIFAVADALYVSRMPGDHVDDALATVGLTESLLTFVYAIGIGLAVATSAVVARRTGEQKPDEAARFAFAGIVLGTLIAVVLGIAGSIFADDLLRLMGAAPGVIEHGTGYARIQLSCNFVILFLFLNNAAFRGAGDPSIAMRTLVLSNAINILLDPCLIYGLGPFPEMGITGAGLATVIGRGTGVLYQLYWMFRGGRRLHLRREHIAFEPARMVHLIRLAIPSTFQNLVATTSWVALIRIVSSFGTDAAAGYTLAIRVVIFAFLPSYGLSNATATLVGQNLGARKPERAERAVWITGFINMLVLLLVTVIFVAIPEPIVRLFVRPGAEEGFVPYAVTCLRVISYGYVFYAWEMVMVQAFNGAGDTRTPLYLNLLCFWAFQVPLAWMLAHGLKMGPEGVFLAVAICYAVAAVLGILLFMRGKWKLKVV